MRGKKQQLSERFLTAMRLMSHRGGSLERVENTLAAFRHSRRMQTPMIMEMDVHLTKDGKVVVLHDGDLERLCGQRWKGVRIEQLKYEELPELVVPKAVKVVEGESDFTRIPLLEEVLEVCKEYPVQIDVKDGSEELIVKTGRMIRAFEREDITVWGSFKYRQSALCRKHFGTAVPLLFSFPRFILTTVMWRVGLLNWLPLYESVAIVPNLEWLLNLSGENWKRRGGRKGLFESLNERGIGVIVWGWKGVDTGEGPGGGVNTHEGFKNIQRSGANGICTDRPTYLRKWLDDNKLRDLPSA